MVDRCPAASASLPNDSQGFQLPGFLQHFSPTTRRNRRLLVVGKERSAGILESFRSATPRTKGGCKRERRNLSPKVDRSIRRIQLSAGSFKRSRYHTLLLVES